MAIFSTFPPAHAKSRKKPKKHWTEKSHFFNEKLSNRLFAQLLASACILLFEPLGSSKCFVDLVFHVWKWAMAYEIADFCFFLPYGTCCFERIILKVAIFAIENGWAIFFPNIY